MNFSENVRYYRKQKRMTQADLANKLNVAQQTVGSWEIGRTEPNLEQQIDLANLFGISLDQLLGVNSQENSDLKEFLRTQSSMTYGGKEISDHDLDLLTRLVRTLLEDESQS